MKTIVKPIIICITLLALCFPTLLQAQEAEKVRLEAIQMQESKVVSYISEKMKLPFPKIVLDQYIATLQQSHEGHDEIANDQLPLLIESYKENYYRLEYFKNTPKAEEVYNIQLPELGEYNTTLGAEANNCPVRNFETGAFGAVFQGFSAIGSTGGYQSGECGSIPTNGVGTFSWTPTVLPTANNFTIVSNGNDPLVDTLKRTNNGSNFAARINSLNPCTPNHGIDRLRTAFVATMNGLSTASFAYALVMENPSNHLNEQPFFIARILDATGVEQDRICIISNPTNPIFTSQNATVIPGCTRSTSGLLWSNWQCGNLNYNAVAGQTYILEFIVADCGAGAHFGYAYIDDICVTCTNVNAGLITLQPTDTCQKTMTVCADYIAPIINSVTGTLIQTGANSPTLQVLQNGNPTAPPIILTNPVINLTNHTICFTVTPATFGTLTGGFDFRITANFQFPSGIVPLVDVHTNPGNNNDYTTNPCAPACACGSWTTTVLTGINGTSLSPGFYPCGTTITNRTISKGQSYRLRFRYNCVGSCNATYNFIENINGTVVSSPAIGGGINIDFTPNEADCGLRSITVTPTCGGMICPPCTICFNVVGCDTCVDPVNDTIYCAPTYGKPIISFCLKNLKPTPIQFYGVTFPAGLQLTTFTLPGDPVPIDTMLDGTIVYQTASPIAPGSNACSFRYRIDGGVYKGQQFCVMVKSFSVYNPANGNFLNCCQDTIPLCFTVPDCIDDCADIVNANITCNTSNQRVLSFQIKNNTPNTLGAYEHFRVFALPNDYFSGFFSLAPGATSSVITHIIPNTIPSGSQYCFTENVHWYYSNGHTCDSICYADTVCLTVPYCGIYPGGDTIKSGYGGGGSTIGSGMGKLIDNFYSGSNEESAINLYPNPTDGLLHIESPYSEQGIQTISIKDMSGREVYFRKAENSHRETLNISHIPTGIYIVTINNTKNFRLIKK